MHHPKSEINTSCYTNYTSVHYVLHQLTKQIVLVKIHPFRQKEEIVVFSKLTKKKIFCFFLYFSRSSSCVSNILSKMRTLSENFPNTQNYFSVDVKDVFATSGSRWGHFLFGWTTIKMCLSLRVDWANHLKSFCLWKG